MKTLLFALIAVTLLHNQVNCCQCFANGHENEPECENNPSRYDPETCITADGRCHWGPLEQAECEAEGSSILDEDLFDFNDLFDNDDGEWITIEIETTTTSGYVETQITIIGNADEVDFDGEEDFDDWWEDWSNDFYGGDEDEWQNDDQPFYGEDDHDQWEESYGKDDHDDWSQWDKDSYGEDDHDNWRKDDDGHDNGQKGKNEHHHGGHGDHGGWENWGGCQRHKIKVVAAILAVLCCGLISCCCIRGCVKRCRRRCGRYRRGCCNRRGVCQRRSNVNQVIAPNQPIIASYAVQHDVAQPTGQITIAQPIVVQPNANVVVAFPLTNKNYQINN